MSASQNAFPSRLREGSGEGATYVLASGLFDQPLPQPLPQAEGEQQDYVLDTGATR